MSVQTTAPQVWRQLERMRKTQLPKVVGRSMDETLRAARKDGAKAITQRINLKSSVVKQNLKGRRPKKIGSIEVMSHQSLYIELSATGSPVPLKEYGARQTMGGATYSVKKGQTRKVYTRLGKKAFISSALGGHVFVGKGPNPPGPRNAPIKKVYGPSLPQYFVTKQVRDPITQAVREVWPKAVARNANYYLNVRGRI